MHDGAESGFVSVRSISLDSLKSEPVLDWFYFLPCSLRAEA